MRRALVIFLILLFPLNVLALSMSVSAIGQAGATEHVNPAPAADPVADADATGHQSIGDLDPDEPPGGTDFHDLVHEEGRVQPAALPDSSIASRLPSRRGREPFPPIKPPPVQ